ncbi:hypothetical protein K458DRAFT_422236 [Lentithecium fluviatile CBS 122367]|uniref:Uncharacterized protein n=1 Tax=Lentithecium fluviatile CBS 122367 TaxID=1168545 RepID=A0A6G1IN94_9PLEO|nr:hypothetical protein K458DRAFT_422236 [Lentithecium fluviatile CBS 122367]
MSYLQVEPDTHPIETPPSFSPKNGPAASRLMTDATSTGNPSVPASSIHWDTRESVQTNRTYRATGPIPYPPVWLEFDPGLYVGELVSIVVKKPQLAPRLACLCRGGEGTLNSPTSW